MPNTFSAAAATSPRAAQVEQNPEIWARRPGAIARAWPSEQMIRLICRSIPADQRAGITAIDVGCGNGRNSTALAEMGFEKVVAIDPSQNLIDSVSRLSASRGLNIHPQCGSLPGIPCPAAQAGLAVAWGVLYVLPSVRVVAESMRDLARVLCPGGFLISDWRTDADCLRKHSGDAIDERTVRLTSDAPLNLAGATYSFWGRPHLESIHEDAGFQIVDLQREEIYETGTNRRFSWWQACAKLRKN